MTAPADPFALLGWLATATPEDVHTAALAIYAEVDATPTPIPEPLWRRYALIAGAEAREGWHAEIEWRALMARLGGAT